MVDYDAINSSDIPPEVPRSEDSAKDPENVLRGHKATLNNPQQSKEAKSHSKQILENADEPYDQSSSDTKTTSSKDEGEKDPGNVARGLKAAISNPGVSEEAKEGAKKKLEALGE